MAIQFETIEPNIWKPKAEGDRIEGVLIRKQQNIGKNNSNLYSLQLKNEGEKILSIWGTTVLDDRMAYCKEGDYIRITYKGIQDNKRGQPLKLFTVERAKTG